MAKMTAKQKDQMITDMALQVKAYLKDSGAERKADNIPMKKDDCRTVDEICVACDIPPSLWQNVKVRAWDLGIPLTHGYFLPYYLGTDGEVARCIIQYFTVVNGLIRSLSQGFMALGKSGTLEDAAKYARQQIGIPLSSVPKLMDACGMPLSEEQTRLLESGDNGYNPSEE